MTADPKTQLADELAAAIDWWRKAGVDNSFQDRAAGWLAEPVEASPPVAAPPKAEGSPPPPPPRPCLGGPPESWPAEVAQFQRWWLAEPSLSEEGTYPRVAPRGAQGAELLLLVPQPEESDRDTLLSGPEGTLVRAMLGAMGVAEERVYFAAALPRHTPLPDWDDLRAQGLCELVSHHVALAAPARIIAFGRLVSALLSHDTAQGAAPLRFFNHDGTMIPLLDAEELDALRRRPRARATFWRRWLEFTDGIA